MASGPARAAETLTDALISGYKSSNILEQNRALLRATDENVAQAMAGLRPVISFLSQTNLFFPSQIRSTSGTTKTTNWSNTISLNAELTVYDNGVTRYATDAAKETVLGLRAALLDLEQQILLNTVQVYMEVIRASQVVSLRESNVRLIAQELRAARDRFEVGEVTRTDVSQAEARLAAARGRYAAAQGDLAVAREAYKAAVGRYPGQLRWPPAPPMTAKSEDAARAIAVRHHPSINEAQHNVTVGEMNIGRARASMGVKVTAGASIGLTDGNTVGKNANLTFRVPIYAGGQLKSLLGQAIARRDAARAALLQSVVVVKQNIGTAWANLAVATASTEASRRQVSAAQVAYNGVREEARLGARTTLDVLNAEQELLDAKSAMISAETQQYVRVYAVLSAMGLLTVDHLKLGIVTYDPAEYYNSATEHPLRKISPQGEALDRVLEFLNRK
jgi:outer membrane protein